jgi:GT2 family glycosyltransferase
MKVSVIILSKTTTQAQYAMTSYCIATLMASEMKFDFEVILVESNVNFLETQFKYPDFVKVIIPNCSFNFHQFLNIGIQKATGKYVALCNNDLVFYPNWFTEIYKVAKENPKILSFSPDGNFKQNNSQDKDFEIGYKVRTHIMGWAIIVNKEIFKKIGLLDERFDFNYADNDYAMTIKAKNILHAIVHNSNVEHLADKKLKNPDGIKLYIQMQEASIYDTDELPKYVFNEENKWLLSDNKALVDFLKFHKKWGSPRMLYRKNKITNWLMKYRLGYFNRFVLYF